jgi:hypothetical protein
MLQFIKDVIDKNEFRIFAVMSSNIRRVGVLLFCDNMVLIMSFWIRCIERDFKELVVNGFISVWFINILIA